MKSHRSLVRRCLVYVVLLSLSTMLALPPWVSAQAVYVPSGSINPNVWSPGASKWEPGQPEGYAEGNVAAMAVELVNLVQGPTYQASLCIEVWKGVGFQGAYYFNEFALWDETFPAPGEIDHVPSTTPIKQKIYLSEQAGSPFIPYPGTYPSGWLLYPGTPDFPVPLYGHNVSDLMVTDYGLEHGTCDAGYLGAVVQFKFVPHDSSPSDGAYILFGGRLAQAGAPLPTTDPDCLDVPTQTCYVPEGMGASAVSGTFQVRIEGAGDKTINFKGPITEATADLELEKVCVPGPVYPGDEFNYVFRVTNHSSVKSSYGLQLVDPLPDDLSYVVGHPVTSTLDLLGGGCAYDSGTNTVTCVTEDSNGRKPALKPGLTWTLTFRVRVVDAESTWLTNSATVWAFTPDPVGAEADNTDICWTTTPVTLAYFKSTRSGDTVRFDWSTATETGNVGFYLYGVGENGRQRINEQLIPSQSVDSLEPRDYIYEATGVGGDRFFVEDVDIRGRTRKHGPFALGQEYGVRAEVEPIDWATIGAEHEAKTAERTGEAKALINKGLAEQVQRAGVAAGGNGWPDLNLLVDRDGLYRVGYEHLLAAGCDLTGAKSSDLALTNRGEPVPIRVEAGRTFGPGGYIEFYGLALDSLYTHTNVYQLQIDAKLAARVAVDGTLPDPSAPPAPYYMETVSVDDNLGYAFYAPAADPWYNREIRDQLASPAAPTFGVDVQAYVVDAGVPAMLWVDMWGGLDWPSGPDHHVLLEFNGLPVGEEWFDGVVAHPVSVELPAGLLQEGANTLTLRVPGDTGSPADIVTLDQYSVTYPRAFVARDGRLIFEAKGARFRVEGLPTADVVVYRLDGGGLTLLTGVEVGGIEGEYSATFAGSGETATYLVSGVVEGVEGLLRPDLEAGQPETDITGGSADYVMIAHPHFIEGLAELVAAREAQGYAVRVVNVDDIYAQYSHGIFDPQPIRDYIAHAAANMGTEYFLLVGGDTYDYHDYRRTGAMSFIPSLYAATDDLVGFAPVDPLYTDLDSDGVPDRAIGRFPVRTDGELAVMVAKTLAYGGKEAKGYGRTAVFAADVSDGRRSFTGDSELFIQQLPVGWDFERAHTDVVGVEEARATLLRRINAGSALTNFVGHSALIYWGAWPKPLLTPANVASLANSGRPTVVAQYGCWNTYYVSSNGEALLQKFLVAGEQGAAAMVGPVALADAASEAALGKLVTYHLTRPGQTIGAAVQAAKAELAGTGAGTADILLGWILLGDPVLAVHP